MGKSFANMYFCKLWVGVSKKFLTAIIFMSSLSIYFLHTILETSDFFFQIWAVGRIGFFNSQLHGLRTPREEIAFTARPKIHSPSQIFRYGQSIFCLPHRPNFSDICDLCFHWVSVVRGQLCMTLTWIYVIRKLIMTH